MTRRIRTLLIACLLALPCAASASAGEKHSLWDPRDPFGIGLGWTNKYGSVGGCPGWQPRPKNPFHAVPLHSSVGQTGARRMLLFPPVIFSPLYDNTPRLFRLPPEYRKCHGDICP